MGLDDRVVQIEHHVVIDAKTTELAYVRADPAIITIGA